MDKLTQCKKMVEYMKMFGPITTLQAIVYLRIVRPASRIHDLKKMGYQIDTELVYAENSDGSKTHYAKYTLIGEPT